MTKFIMWLVFTLTLIWTNSSFAATLNDVEMRLICAAASMASYNEDNGFLVRSMIKNHGWSIESIIDETDKANAKVLILGKKYDDGTLIKIVSTSGTDDAKDAKVDFRTKMVPFASNNDDTEADSSTTPMVHKGFKDYANVILKNDVYKNLINEVSNNPNAKLYLTGHSLGGAVSIIMAAKLIELGLNPNQLTVMTFGAPAVGNKSFADAFENKINLTRITVSGDPIKKSLHLLGYVHFGELLKYKPVSTVDHFPHKMSVYLDCAIRDYYDVKLGDNANIFNNPDNQPNAGKNADLIYVAPMQVMKNSFTDEDFKYVFHAMRDELTMQLPNVLFDEVGVKEVDEIKNFAEFDDSLTDVLNKATKLNCKYILVQYLQAKKMRNDRFGDYRVSLEEIVYDMKGFPVSMQTKSVTTKELTMIEAAIFAQASLHFEQD